MTKEKVEDWGNDEDAEGEKPSSGKTKPKAIKVRLVSSEHEAYGMLGRLIEKHHEHLGEVNFQIAYKEEWKADQDGRVKLCDVRKASDLDFLMTGYDIVLILNEESWATMSEKQKIALCDHMLCRIKIKQAANGDDVVDDDDRKVYRLAKPDVVEFSDVIKRHGTWTAELEDAAKAIQSMPLFNQPEAEDEAPKKGRKKGSSAVAKPALA